MLAHGRYTAFARHPPLDLMAGKWRTLSLGSDSLPQLLIKAVLDVSGYTIHLTDLSRIWGETLTKKQLFRRALDDGCSIDPTEGDDQVRILIEKVGSAIEQRDGTSISIQQTNEDSLAMKLTAPLPHPLPELHWDVILSPQPARNVQAELVTPLLHHAQNLQTMMQNLVHEIQDKDRVIAKITDRLEQSGQDLTDVFPGVSNIKLARKRSHQTQREQLAKHVKGLGDFDERDWKARHSSMDGHGAIHPGTLNDLLGEMPPASEASPEVMNEWWRYLSDSDNAIARSAAPVNTAQNHQTQRNDASLKETRDTSVEVVQTNASGDTAMVDADDLGFQRQATPPELKAGDKDRSQRIQSSYPNEQQAVTADDESTEDEDDDLDAPHASKPPTFRISTTLSPMRRSSASPNTAMAASRKLGTISGRKKACSDKDRKHSAKDPSPAPAPQKPRSKLGKIGGRPKKSDTPEPEPEPVPDPKNEPSASASAPPPKSRLGRIGGKRPGPSSQESAPYSSATEGSASSPPAKRHGKLGRIGGKKADESPAAKSAPEPAAKASEGNERKSRARESEEKEPTPPRETSQDRADRRREELKRQLEEKAKAPAKKKRKF